jgi:AraC-like DNA-binding protein
LRQFYNSGRLCPRGTVTVFKRVGAIARQCGFADLYHFSHRFSARYGVPPTAYRGMGTPVSSQLDHPGLRRLALSVWG